MLKLISNVKVQMSNRLNLKIISFLAMLFLGITLGGCAEEDKIDLSQFPINIDPGTIGDTTYIPITPVITGFNEPSDIHFGYDQQIYVADKNNNRVVQLNLAGGIVSYSDFILRPKKVSQDRNFDLLVIATVIDTIPPNILDSIDVVYRFRLQPNGGILSGVVPTIAFRSNQPTPIPGDHGSFTGIATFQDNYYLVSRSGPNNSSPIDPDNAIFRIDRFDNTNPVPERLPGFEAEGQGLLSLQEISGITAFSYNNVDLIYIQKSSNAAFKVQWCLYDEAEGTYIPKFSPSGNVDLLRNGLLIEPADITIDQFNNIYIIDSYKDSLYKFNSLGSLRSESFGGEGATTSQFSNPLGVAFFNKTLYICDTGNNRILRFILSTDIN
jgi:NHL repeat